VPRAKYIKPPGPLPSIGQVQRSRFRFREDQWRKLKKLLPERWASLPIPSAYIEKAATAQHPPKRTLKTVADVVIHETEGAISSYLTHNQLISEYGMPTPARVRAAIRCLRQALKPFVREWVDTETAVLIPIGLDDALAAREQEIAGQRLTPRRALALLCQAICKMLASACDLLDRIASIPGLSEPSLHCGCNGCSRAASLPGKRAGDKRAECHKVY
jgi:hypothetical protein